MPNILTCSKYASSPGNGRQVSYTSLNGLATSTPLGSPMRRESFITLTENINNYVGSQGNCVGKLAGKIFCTTGTAGGVARLYEYVSGAKALLIDADPSGGSSLPKRGDSVTGATGVGTVLEDYVAGDDFIVIDETTTGFVDGEEITISGSVSGSNTADLISSGSVVANSGEWIAKYTSTRTLVGREPVSGLVYHTGPSGATTVGFASLNTTADEEFEVVVYDIVNDRWYERTALGNHSASNDVVWGATQGLLTVRFQQSSGNVLENILYNFETNSYSSASFSVSTGHYRPGMPHEWAGEFVHNRVTANNSNALLNSSTTALSPIAETWGSDDWNGSFSPTEVLGSFVGGDNALYCVGKKGEHYSVARLHKEDDGSIILDVRGSVNTSDYTQLRQILLPDELDINNGGINHLTIHKILDTQTTPGTPIHRYLWKATNLGGPAELTWGGWTDIDGGSTATWDGTTTVVFNSDVESELSINDYIRHNSTNRVFIVTDVTGTNVTIANESTTDPTGAAIANTIPSTNSVSSKLEQMNLVAGYGDGVVLTGHSLVQADTGGGEFFYTPDEITIGDSRVFTTGPGIRVEFKLYDPNSLGLTRNVDMYYTDPQDPTNYGKCTLASASGTISDNAVTDLDVDNGVTTHWLVWNAAADGFTSSSTGIDIRLRAFA